MKPKKAAKILSQLPGSTPMNQPQLVTNILIKRELGRAGFRRKVTSTHSLPKPNVSRSWIQHNKLLDKS